MGQWMPLLCGGLLPALMEGPQAPTCHGGPARGAEAPPDLPSPPQTPDSGRNQIPGHADPSETLSPELCFPRMRARQVRGSSSDTADGLPAAGRALR